MDGNNLECDNFPPSNTLDQMCMEGGGNSSSSALPTPSNAIHNYPDILRHMNDYREMILK